MPHRVWRVGVLYAAMASLVCAVAVSYYSSRVSDARAGATKTADDLDRLVPPSLPGWQTTEVPLGATEFETQDARKELQFDAYVFRRYRRGGHEFDVYLAYWSAGKMPTIEVGKHTPDGCWVHTGWRTVWARHNSSLRVGNQEMAGGELREYLAPAPYEEPRFVAFWHLVGGVSHSSRYDSFGSAVGWWWHTGMGQLSRSEQFFLRISGNEPFEKLTAEPGFRDVVSRLASISNHDVSQVNRSN